MRKITLAGLGLFLAASLASVWSDDQPSGFPLRLGVGSDVGGTCFLARNPMEALTRDVRRETERIFGGAVMDTDLINPDAKAKELAAQWNPVFATPSGSWKEFLSIHVVAREGARYGPSEISIEWIHYTRPKAGADTLRFFDRQEIRGVPGAIGDGVDASFALRLARGGSFPDGEYRIRATYDSTANRVGLARLRKTAESKWFKLAAPRTEVENLELAYERVLQLRHYYHDLAGTKKGLQALLAKRPNCARSLAFMMRCCNDMGNDEEALVWGRRYNEVFEKGLDPLWFTPAQFKKSGLPDIVYDLTNQIRATERHIENKKFWESQRRR